MICMGVLGIVDLFSFSHSSPDYLLIGREEGKTYFLFLLKKNSKSNPASLSKRDALIFDRSDLMSTRKKKIGFKSSDQVGKQA